MAGSAQEDDGRAPCSAAASSSTNPRIWGGMRREGQSRVGILYHNMKQIGVFFAYAPWWGAALELLLDPVPSFQMSGPDLAGIT